MGYPKLKFVEGGTYIAIIYPTFYVRLGEGIRFYRWFRRSLDAPISTPIFQTSAYTVKLEKDTTKDRITLYFSRPRLWIFIGSATTFIGALKELDRPKAITKPKPSSPGLLKILNESYNDILLGGNSYVVSWPIIMSDLPPPSFQEHINNINQKVGGFEYLVGSGGILIRYGSSHTIDKQFIFNAAALPKHINDVVGKCTELINKEIEDELAYIEDSDDDIVKRLTKMNEVILERFRGRG